MVFNKVNDAYQTVKNGLEAEVALATAEQKMQLADALVALSQMKVAMMELEEENAALRKNEDISTKLKYGKSGAVWLDNEVFCGGCFGRESKLVHLAKLNDSVFDCPSCKARYRLHKSTDIESLVV